MSPSLLPGSSMRLRGPATPRDVLRDLTVTEASHGAAGLAFSASGPIAVTLAVTAAGGLTQAQSSTWVFGIFFSAGCATLLLSLWYRRPYGFAWSIPGTVLLGPSLQHLSFPEVVGAFFTTGLLVLVLGASGLVKRIMGAVPLPIVMAMVAAVFLPFGVDVVTSSQEDPLIALPMVVVFLLLSALPSLGKRIPPVLGALATGLIAVVLSGRMRMETAGPVFAAPVFTPPEFTWQAQMELVVPLAITVLVVQNGQGTAVLTAAGHRPPVTVFAVASGVFSVVNAIFGAVSACVTGPTNALLTSSSERQRHYTAAVVYGVLSLICALAAPLLTRVMTSAPSSFILTLGGLAMLRALQQAFIGAFSHRHTLGALVAFIVTASGLSLFSLHAAFWGILFGTLITRLLERDDAVPLSQSSSATPSPDTNGESS